MWWVVLVKKQKLTWIWWGCPAVMLDTVHAASCDQEIMRTHTCDVHLCTQACSGVYLLHVGLYMGEKGKDLRKHILVQHILCLLVWPSDNVAQGPQCWGLQRKCVQCYVLCISLWPALIHNTLRIIRHMYVCKGTVKIVHHIVHEKGQPEARECNLCLCV